MTYRLGLTGSIATGKSTVSRYFKHLGFPVVDADLVARQVVEPGEEGLEAIVKEFGEEYVFPNGLLNRKKLATTIFSNPEARKRLNRVVQPCIQSKIKEKVKNYEAEGKDLIVLDIPLLYEMKYEQEVDAVMVVYVPESIQLKRLMARDHLEESEAIERMISQMNIEQKVRRADVIIDNTDTIHSTEQQVEAWLAINGFVPS